MWYVYQLIDPRDGKPFYVGKGKGNRINAHEREALMGGVSAKCQMIREIQGFGHEIIKRKVKEFELEQDAFDLEATLISNIGLQNLTNCVSGGGTAKEFSHLLESDRNKIICAAMLMPRAKNGHIPKLRLFGQLLDVTDVFATTARNAIEVIQRRGKPWCNRIARKKGFEFV